MAFIDRNIPYSNRRLRLISRAYLHAEQEGRCAICLQEREDLVVDHEHATDAIRGLLCNSCNVAIGHFREHPDYLLRAISYLGWSGEKLREAEATVACLRDGTIENLRCWRCDALLAEQVSTPFRIRCRKCKSHNPPDEG